MSIALYLLAVLAGFALLIWSADRFVDGAVDIARYLGVSPLVVGMVVVGFGTSAPEMLVSGTAAFTGSPNLGVGNAIGSNIANIALVLGMTALFFALPVHSRIISREIPLLLAAQLLAFFLITSGDFGFVDGLILVAGLFAIMGWMVYQAHHARKDDPLVQEIMAEQEQVSHSGSAWFWTIAGLILLLASSNILVWGASNIATLFGISQLVIGLTIVAIGTSLPEIAATMVSAKKGEIDMAVGNIVGSNLFNTLGVLALPALITRFDVEENAIYRDFPVMLLLTVLLYIFARGCWQKELIGFWKGLILLLIFIGYGILLYFHTINKTVCTSWLCL